MTELWPLSQDLVRRQWRINASATVLCRRGNSFVNNHLKMSRWSYFRPMVVVQTLFGSVTFVHWSLQVIRLLTLFGYNFIHARYRAIQIVSSCSAGQDASTDMHIGLLWSYLTYGRWPESTWFRNMTLIFCGSKDMFRCVSTRETRWRSSNCSKVLSSKVIHEKHMAI